jgi:aryl-alcohol dehydrogenase-like predicted oxidoreductase
METRPLGTTGHESSILAFGAIALDHLSQPEADGMVEEVLDRGVNHVDVAPTYGDAETKLAPVLKERRDEVFLACKTRERTYNGAWGELHRSLDRLGVDSVELYQFHAVTRYDELETILGEGDDPGALAAFEDAKRAGLIDHVGLTSHGDPSLIRAAMKRIDALETVMFPTNYTLAAKDGPEHDYGAVLDLAEGLGLGTLGIKAFAKAPWPDDLADEDRPYETWYEPYDEPDDLETCLRFALSQGLASITNAGDPRLVPAILDAAESFEPMGEAEQAALVERAREAETPVPRT